MPIIAITQLATAPDNRPNGKSSCRFPAKTLRDQIGHCAAKSKIEEAEITDDHPRYGKDSESISTNMANERGNGKQGRTHRRDLTNQIPSRVANEQ